MKGEQWKGCSLMVARALSIDLKHDTRKSKELQLL